jgi:hypothetical protein
VKVHIEAYISNAITIEPITKMLKRSGVLHRAYPAI